MDHCGRSGRSVVDGLLTSRQSCHTTSKRYRFPPDSMFRLVPQERREVVTNCDHSRKLMQPLAVLSERGIGLSTSEESS